MVNTDIDSGWGDRIHAIAVQSGGLIVAVGARFDQASPQSLSRDVALARYEPDGDVDPTFVGGGTFYQDLGGCDEAADVRIAVDDKIVVSGQRCDAAGDNCDTVVARLEANGDFDLTFNDGQPKYIDFGGADNSTMGGLAVTHDGKILVAGRVWNGRNYDFAVYRLKTNGNLDDTFGTHGKVKFGFGPRRNDSALDLLLQGGGVVVVGTSCNASQINCDFALARLTSSGALDTIFSDDGKKMTDFGEEEVAFGAALDPGDKLVLAGGYQTDAGESRVAVARYTSSGDLDTTFSRNGKKTVPAAAVSLAQDVLVTSSGKIVVGGVAQDGPDVSMVVARLKSGGGLDSAFSTDGIVEIDFGGLEIGFALLEQVDGKYVIAGTTTNGANDDFALARLLP
jgi:uncharacterized delta-60 repeat protein